MAKASKDSVNTFTIGFSGETGVFEDERKYARMVASRYGTNHREYAVRPELSGLIEAIVRSFDEPFADDSTIPSYFVCKIARENVTVALSGLGGDEAFCGYERYLGFHLSQWFNRLPVILRSGLIAPLVETFPESRSGGYRVNHLKRFEYPPPKTMPGGTWFRAEDRGHTKTRFCRRREPLSEGRGEAESGSSDIFEPKPRIPLTEFSTAT
jgi:asparagine synthase (glutamine-hydrolysing)